MDAGLKSYGGALFRQVRDAGEPIFKNLPAPQPPRRFAAASSASTAAAPAPRAPDMSSYYEGEGGGCFGRGSRVCLARPSSPSDFAWTDVTAVQPGDFLRVADGKVAD